MEAFITHFPDLHIKSAAAAENSEVIPEALHTFFRDDGRVLGHLVVDSSINGLSAGGIRMVPEMPLADLCHLARTMTLKYSFLKWPFGGAKAAILTHRAGLSGVERERRLRLFAERLRPFRGRYVPGEDAGTNADDLRLVSQVGRLGWEQGRTDSGFHTATTVRICVQQMARQLQLAPECSTVSVEGFGKVGGWVARQLAERGFRVIAVSTAAGAIYHRDGLDVERLIRAREAAGAECVNQYRGATRIDGADLLGLSTHFLVPCALSWSIREANADAIRAKAIVCGANNAVTEKARVRLAAQGVLYVPDFVSNSGGALGSIMESLCWDRARASRLLAEQFEPKAEALLARARRTGQSLETAAVEIAKSNREEMLGRKADSPNRLFALMASAFRCGLLPKTLVKLFGPAYARRTMG